MSQPHTFYDSTIAVLQSLLTTLSHILHVAETQHANPDSLLSARLHESMYPLADQIRIATQFSSNLVARLTAHQAVTFDGCPDTFAQCYERIETVLKLISEADKDVVNEQGEVLSATQMGPGVEVPMSGAGYAHRVVLPNVYFHVTTAYGILRREGVEIGKRDYYQGFFPM